MRFLVLGDACRDVYISGDSTRKNPEAAAPLLNNLVTEVRDGMAANVANNLRALGANVTTSCRPNRGPRRNAILTRVMGHNCCAWTTTARVTHWVTCLIWRASTPSWSRTTTKALCLTISCDSLTARFLCLLTPRSGIWV
jgi:hypothetical protein